MKLAVFTKNRTNPAYDGARYAADLVGARHGATVRHYVPGTPDDPAQQEALIDEAMQWQPDAVLIAPVHLEKLRPAMERIAQAGTPLFGFVNRMPGVPYVTYVGSDDGALACALAKYLFERMGGAGSVAVVEGPSHSITNNDRVRAFLAEAERHPKIRIVARIAGEYQRADARAAFATFIEGVPCPDAILCANDIMAIGVLEALDERPAPRPAPLVAGINAIPQAMQAIADGRMLATADFNPMQMAALAAEAAVAHLRGEPTPSVIELPVQVVDRQLAQTWGVSWESRPIHPLKDFNRE